MKDTAEISTISIIVPVHNGGDDFKLCLSGIKNQTRTTLEIIVVANGCSDDSEESASQTGVSLIRLPEAVGAARARNEGAGQAKGDILFFVDADVLLPPDAVEQLCFKFKEKPGLAALMGSYDDTPAQTNFLSQYKNLLHHYVHQTSRIEASTFWGACGAIRRDIFTSVGGFDEGYKTASIEDIELGGRLVKQGYKIELVKTLQVKHLKKWTPYSLLKSDIFHRAVPWAELILKNRQFQNNLNLRWSGRVSVVMVWLLPIPALIGIWVRESVVILTTVAFLLLLINFKTYSFFRRKRGFRFAMKAIPWHWFYYFYSGIGFFIALVKKGWGEGGGAGSRGDTFEP